MSSVSTPIRVRKSLIIAIVLGEAVEDRISSDGVCLSNSISARIGLPTLANISWYAGSFGFIQAISNSLLVY